MSALEKTRLTLGMVALTDSAPLVVALEKGWFAAEGLDVALSRQPSWASLRDRLVVGALDAAQMLAAMPLALTLGLEAMEVPMLTAFGLGFGGNAITVSNRLSERLREAAPEAMALSPVPARALQTVIAADRLAGRPRLSFATVHPFSEHNYMLRDWLADGGIDPDADVDISVIPPPRMAVALGEGRIDGYCVGEPWNTLAVRTGIGHIVVAGCELGAELPGKVLGVTREWAERHPASHGALIRALAGAAAWLDRSENRLEAARLLCQPAYLDVPFEIAAMTLSGVCQFDPDRAPRPLPDFHVFHRYDANRPRHAHAVWLLTQMTRWGQSPHSVEPAAVAAVYRPDLYSAALASQEAVAEDIVEEAM